jgi:hypothetical protein
MFSFLRRPKPAIDDVEAAQINTGMLSFDPARIVRAITFHLLDEGQALAVKLRSYDAAVRKLSQRMYHLTISAGPWAEMENSQRLQWLLKQSGIAVKSTPFRPAILWVRR